MASSLGSTALLEVCVESPSEAENALLSGASRIELCSDLKVGGLSPSTDLVRAIAHAMDAAVASESPSLPLQIMVRFSEPSFIYTASQVAQMVSYIHQVKALNDELLSKQESTLLSRRQSFISGFVFGCLRPTPNATHPIATSDETVPSPKDPGSHAVELEIDLEQTHTLVQASHPYSVTFHRAFDEVTDKERALLELRKLNVDRLLTSGGIGSVDAHMEALRSLISQSGSLSSSVTGLTQEAGCTGLKSTSTKASNSVSTSSPNVGACPEVPLKSIIVMPGGGVRSHNARKLIDLGAQELHSSTPFFVSRIE